MKMLKYEGRKKDAIDILWDAGWTYEMISEALNLKVNVVMDLKHGVCY